MKTAMLITARAIGKIMEFVLTVFLILKLLGRIGWSWWLVMAPLWIPAVIAAVAVLIYIVKENNNEDIRH